MPIITNSQLDNICLRMLEAANSYDLSIYPLIHTMYTTGLRINEVYQLNRWSFPDAGSCLVELEKNSGNRSLTHIEVPDEFYNICLTYPTTNFQFTLRQVRHFIRGSSGWARLSVGGKEINSHLFRYNYCRRLYDGGMSLADIRSTIVHSSLMVTSGYIFNDIIGADTR